MIFEFLQPISDDLLIDIHKNSNQSLAKKVVFHTEHETPNLENNTIAILGVLENRGNELVSIEPNLELLRLQFYALYPGNWNVTIYDLGDIIPGNTLEDTYFALNAVCAL
jgi:hypothetical protein